MRKIIKYCRAFLLALPLLGLQGCEDKANDWPVEKGEDRLYMALTFESSKIGDKFIEIKHTKVLDAATYVFEFSKDDFATIERSVNILADTLTVFAPSNTPMRIEYRTLFEGFDGTTDYWVRMQAVNEDGTLKSKYNSFEFTTAEEYIFTNFIQTTNSITPVWAQTNDVTHIVLSIKEKEAEDEKPAEYRVLETRQLTAAEIAAAQVTFSGLGMGVEYRIEIYNGEVLRGRDDIRTLGIAGSSVYAVKDNDNYESIKEALVALAGQGAKDVTVQFSAGKTYEIGGRIMIPTGVQNISFVGSEDANGDYPMLNVGKFEIESEINNANFQYLTITGGGDMMFNVGGKVFNEILFENCNITQLNSIVRLYDGAVGNRIRVNKCWVSRTGGWGMLNVGAGNTIGSIVVTNSTLTEINTRFADVRVKTEIEFKNITHCNINENMGHLWLFDNNNNASVKIEDCILSGPNGNIEIKSTNGNYSNISISYIGNYKTNDLIEKMKGDEKESPLTGISEVPLDIYGLFVDPENGDFHIRKGIGFAGTGKAGDPRWF